jgi:hypothetical protein
VQTGLSEQAGVATALQICIRETLGSSLLQDTDYPEVLIGFLQSAQAIARVLPQLLHDRVVANRFQFMNHSTIQRYTDCPRRRGQYSGRSQYRSF